MEDRIQDRHPAIIFFKPLYGHCKEGFLNLRYKPKDENKLTQQKFLQVSQIDTLPNTLNQLQRQHDCYFGVAMRTKGDGTKDGIYKIPLLWADIDFKDGSKKEVLNRLNGFSLKPSARISSGNGFHLYWKLKEPASRKEIPKIENLNKRLAYSLKGDMGSTDAARLLRVPGTLNHKYTPAREVTIDEFYPEREYNLDDFDQILPQLEKRFNEQERPKHIEWWEKESLKNVQEGERNTTVARLAGRYLGMGISRDKTLVLLLDDNFLFKLPLSVEEVETTLDKIAKTHERNLSLRGKESSQIEILDDGTQCQDIGEFRDKVIAQIKFPEEAWIGPFAEYRELIKDVTEASDVFHFGVLLVILGLHFGKDFYIKNPHTTYFNFYNLLIGPTGEAYKTTALKYGKRILQSLSVRGEDSTKIIGTPVSSEGLVTSFDAENGTKILSYIDEMKILFGNAQRNSTSNLIATINQFHNEYDEISLPGLQKRIAKKPFLSIIGGTVPEWLDSALSKEVTLGGFINRFIVFYGETKKVIPRPNDPAEDRWGKFIQKIINRRKVLPKEGCEMTHTGEAFEFYDQWYRERKNKRKNLPTVIRPLTAREPFHVDKLSGIFSLSNGRSTIELKDIEAATKVIEYSSSWVKEIFKDVTMSRTAKLDQLIQKYHEDSPKEKRWVQQRIGGNYSCEEFNRSYKSLVDAGLLESVRVVKKDKEILMFRSKA